jgi:phosphatidylglycerophosphate synthase
VLRLLLAIVFARTLADGSWTPLVAFALAATSDYVDGPLARRAGGASRYGVLLDSSADIVFVLVALSAGVVGGRLVWIVPVAVACAAAPYLAATLLRSRATGGPARAYSAVGHWAGICNYALAGLVAGSAALPGPVWPGMLLVGSAVVIALNLSAVGMRLRPNR